MSRSVAVDDEEWDRILQYGTFLGFDALMNPQLIPILRDGLNAAIPDGWVVALGDTADEVYYYNGATGVKLTEHPNDRIVRGKCQAVLENRPETSPPASFTNAMRNMQLQPAAAQHQAEEKLATTSPSVPVTSGTPQGSPPVRQPSMSDSSFDRTLSSEETRDLASRDVENQVKDFLAQIKKKNEQPAGGVGPASPQEALPQQPKIVYQRLDPSQHHPPRPTSTATVDVTRVKDLEAQVKVLRAQLSDAEQARSEEAAKAKEAPVPAEFVCPITSDIMEDPVVTADGYTYERAAITKWLKKHRTSPCTNLELPNAFMAPNIALRAQIQAFLSGSPA